MTYRINILTEGFVTPNGKAFLYPFYAFRDTLKAAGFRVKVFTKIRPGLRRCDCLLVDSKFHKSQWQKNAKSVIKDFERFKKRKNLKVIYCDTTDSSGSIQTELLPLVDKYCKAQLLKDRRIYTNPHYGERIYSNYYHNYFQVKDKNESYSKPIETKYLKKLAVSWNSGIADYSTLGPLKMSLRHFVPCNRLLKHPNNFTPAGGDHRTLEVHCRMGLKYHRESVAWQRKEIRKILFDQIQTDKLSRQLYLDELSHTKVVLSPFGWGEITLKDFECFAAGALLLKPDMSHLETWPNFYESNVTYRPFNWNLEDLEEVLEFSLSDDPSNLEIAHQGQERYREHILPDIGGTLFVQHLKLLLQ